MLMSQVFVFLCCFFCIWSKYGYTRSSLTSHSSTVDISYLNVSSPQMQHLPKAGWCFSLLSFPFYGAAFASLQKEARRCFFHCLWYIFSGCLWDVILSAATRDSLCPLSPPTHPRLSLSLQELGGNRDGQIHLLPLVSWFPKTSQDKYSRRPVMFLTGKLEQFQKGITT